MRGVRGKWKSWQIRNQLTRRIKGGMHRISGRIIWPFLIAGYRIWQAGYQVIGIEKGEYPNKQRTETFFFSLTLCSWLLYHYPNAFLSRSKAYQWGQKGNWKIIAQLVIKNLRKSWMKISAPRPRCLTARVTSHLWQRYSWGLAVWQGPFTIPSGCTSSSTNNNNNKNNNKQSRVTGTIHHPLRMHVILHK